MKDKEDDYKYKNEKEIKKNCTIKINGKSIESFDYFYKFKKEGNFKLEYLFINNIENVAYNNMSYMFSKCIYLTKKY